ncbi:MAG TPA: S8 family serine peptidase [Thermoanaerobaculia bacterium]|jgi:hypothetical protein
MHRWLLLPVLAVVMALPALAGERVIVEFREAPLAVRRGVAVSSYRESFQRFRRDLAGFAPARGAKSATEAPSVTREYFRAFHGVALEASPDVIAHVKTLPYVRAVTLDTEVRAHANGVDGVGLVGARKLWETRGARGAGIVIAIIDSGIDYRHPALGGGFGPGHKVAGGWDFVNDDADPLDDHFHGTHVAGIAAANGPELEGVAPDATLLAFKVLNSSGRGFGSAILAAIERTVDPNGDGDLADRVDVANVSLGGFGHPDDPMARAVDVASAAGVVFTISAGNAGTFMAIGTPGVARTAITVGSTLGADAMAVTSSRGPSMRELALKPEVIAPGEHIRSTFPNNDYGELNGTSMAAPHVAGLAALLLELHPGWTPAQVKSALTNTATLIDAEVIAQGGGFVDAVDAAGTTLFASPAAASFGRGNVSAASWTREQTVTITNTSAETRTLSAAGSGTPAGVQLTVAPAAFTLAPGASQEVTLTLAVTNATATTTESLTLGGSIVLTGDGQRLSVPWAAVKAARATVTYAIGFPFIAFMNDEGQAGLLGWFDPVTMDVLLPAGQYDLLLASIEPDETESLLGEQLRMFVREQLRIDGEHLFAFDVREPLPRLRLAASAASGELLTDLALRTGPEETVYRSEIRLQRSGQTDVFFPFPIGGRIAEVEISPFSDRWMLHAIETCVDRPRNDVYIVAHEPVRGVSESRSLTRARADVATFGLHFPRPTAGPLTDVVIVPHIQTGDAQPGYRPVVETADGDGDWSGRLHLTERAGELVAGVLFGLHAEDEELTVGPLHLHEGRLVSSYQRDPGPAVYAASPGETLLFREGLFHPRLSMMLSPEQRFFLTGRIGGRFGETFLHRTLYEAYVELRNSTGTLVSGPLRDVGFNLLAPEPGAYVVEMTMTATSLGGLPMTGTLRYDVDTRRADVQPPALTSLRVVDGNGTAVNGLPLRSAAYVVFSAADIHLDDAFTPSYHRIRPEATRVAWRVHGTTAWQSVTPSLLGEYAPETGHLFRADLTAATATPALIDLRVELTDESSNTTTWTLSRAFATGLAHRRRAAAR